MKKVLAKNRIPIYVGDLQMADIVKNINKCPVNRSFMLLKNILKYKNDVISHNYLCTPLYINIIFTVLSKDGGGDWVLYSQGEKMHNFGRNFNLTATVYYPRYRNFNLTATVYYPRYRNQRIKSISKNASNNVSERFFGRLYKIKKNDEIWSVELVIE